MCTFKAVLSDFGELRRLKVHAICVPLCTFKAESVRILIP